MQNMEDKMRHPKEMYFLSAIEMCQRFAFWGIANLLVLYVVQYYQFSDAKATHLYGLFSGIAFILPVLGGFIADRTSYRGSVIFGCLATALGCFLISLGHLFFLYLALILTALGTSIFTPSIYTLLGTLYHDKHHLREGGFSIYYASVNIGVFLATFILGSFGQFNHWGLAFSVAGFVQLLGLFLFFKVMKSKQFAHLHCEKTKTSLKKNEKPLKSHEKDRVIVICILSALSILFWMAYNQGWSSMSLFALRFTDRSIGGFEIPASWLLSVESLYLVLLAFPLAGIYKWLAKRKLDPSPPAKTAWSLVMMGLCFLIMMGGSSTIPAHQETGNVSPFYLLSAYGCMAIGEMLLAPIGLALVTHLSPHRYTALLVGVWYVCIGIANYSGGLLAGLLSQMREVSDFFDIFVLSTLIPAFILFFFIKKLNSMRHATKF